MPYDLDIFAHFAPQPDGVRGVMNATAPPAAGTVLKGIGCVVAAGLLMTCQDTTVKWLSGDFATGEIMFWRGLLSFLPLSLLIWWQGGWSRLKTKRPREVGLRAALAALTSLLIVVSLRHLPIADALAIVFVSPLLLTALSSVVLGERVGPRRWVAVAVGFGSVLLMVKPSGEVATLAVLAPLGAALASASRDVVTRRLGATDGATTILFYSMVLSTLVGFFDMPKGLAVPAPGDLAIFLAAGCAWSTAHLFSIMALIYVEASITSPFRYLSLVWAAILGFLVFGDVPDIWLGIGGAFVVASGIYVARRERALAALSEPVRSP